MPSSLSLNIPVLIFSSTLSLASVNQQNLIVLGSINGNSLSDWIKPSLIGTPLHHFLGCPLPLLGLLLYHKHRFYFLLFVYPRFPIRISIVLVHNLDGVFAYTINIHYIWYIISKYMTKKKKKGNYGLMIREEKTRTTPQRKKRVLKIT